MSLDDTPTLMEPWFILGRTVVERNLTRLGAIVIALMSWGCSMQPDPGTLHIPDTAGLVLQSQVVGQDYRLTLDDGRTLTFPVNGNLIQGKQPRVDTVIVAGTQPVRWLFSADLRSALGGGVPPGCYVLLGDARMNETHVFQTVRHVKGEVVMALPKTGDWSVVALRLDVPDGLAGAGTCINPLGQAFGRIY
jgi:hypothetical protein